jgi:RND superfamily putative drug exporter
VFHAKTGKLTDSADRTAIAATLKRVGGLPDVASVVSPYAAGQNAISGDGTIAFATVNFDETANALLKAAVDKVITTAESARSAMLDVQLGGQAIEQAQQASLGFATVVGIAAAILILLISFGSFTAMGLPIATALFGLGAGIGVINLASHVIDMPSFATELALMIGLGVGVDYALFIVTRVHEEWQARRDASAAVREGLAHTGRVITAAAAVMVAVFGAFAISGDRVLEMFGLAMASAVLLDALVVRMLLLPAVLQLLGRTTWALPRWLDGRLPRVAIEAEPSPKPRPALEPAFEARS